MGDDRAIDGGGPKGVVVGQVNINDVAKVLAFVELRKLVPALIPALILAADKQKDLLWKQIEKELGLPANRLYGFKFPDNLQLDVVDMGPMPDPSKGDAPIKK